MRQSSRKSVSMGDFYGKRKLPMVMPSITICVFLTLTNSFKLFDENLALTGGDPNHMTEMIRQYLSDVLCKGRSPVEGTWTVQGSIVLPAGHCHFHDSAESNAFKGGATVRWEKEKNCRPHLDCCINHPGASVCISDHYDPF